MIKIIIPLIAWVAILIWDWKIFLLFVGINIIFAIIFIVYSRESDKQHR